MPSFGDVLDATDAQAIQAFVIEKAIEDRELRDSPRWWLAVKDFCYSVAAWLIVVLAG